MEFSQPRALPGLQGDFGLMDIEVKAQLYPGSGGSLATYTQRHPNDGKDPSMEMEFENPPATVSKLRLEIRNYSAGSSANIHIMELKLLP
jgi:hypothetical protein